MNELYTHKEVVMQNQKTVQPAPPEGRYARPASAQRYLRNWSRTSTRIAGNTSALVKFGLDSAPAKYCSLFAPAGFTVSSGTAVLNHVSGIVFRAQIPSLSYA